MRHQGEMHVVIRITEIQQALRVSVQADWVQADPQFAQTAST
jgi:hypothetical protein